MHRPFPQIWPPLAIAVPIVSGIASLCFGFTVAGVVGVATGVVNAGLLVRRLTPRRIPSFIPPERRKPVVVPTVRYPGNG